MLTDQILSSIAPRHKTYLDGLVTDVPIHIGEESFIKVLIRRSCNGMDRPTNDGRMDWLTG